MLTALAVALVLAVAPVRRVGWTEIAIPRDADAQFASGTPVSLAKMQPVTSLSTSNLFGV